MKCCNCKEKEASFRQTCLMIDRQVSFSRGVSSDNRMQITRESMSGTTQAGLCPECIKRLAKKERSRLTGHGISRAATGLLIIGVIAIVIGLMNQHNRNYSSLFFKVFLGGGALALLSVPLFITSRIASSNDLRKAPWKLLGRRGLDEGRVVQGCKLYVPVGDNYYRDLSEFRRINGWLSSQAADKLYREVIQSGAWRTVPEALEADAPAQQPTKDVPPPQDEKPASASKPTPVQTAKPWTPPIPAAKTELGERLKQRFIEFDIHGSAEQLTPYFDEALAAARDADDPHTFYWACRTLHELLRLPENDAFRKRAGEISALERVRQRVSLLQLDAVRYNQPDPKLNEIVAANLKALNGRDMVEALEDARRFNAAWIEVAGKAGKYPGSMKEAERDTFEKEVCAICARLNCCSALDQLVNFIVKIMQAVQQTEQMGGGVFTMSVNLQTGARETSRNPTLSEAEDFGVRMVASLPREALMRCLENDDFSIDPTADRHNYDLFLRRAASRVGLIA